MAQLSDDCFAFGGELMSGSEALGLIERHRVTFSYGVTTFLMDLLAAGLEGRDLASLQIYMCGGASIPPSVAYEAMARLPGRLVPIFGMTEHGHSTGTDLATPHAKLSSTDGSPTAASATTIVSTS